MASSADPGGVLHGCSALVTGGSRGIGRAIAEALVSAGVRTIIMARDAAGLDATCAEIGAESIVCDVADPAGVELMLDEIVVRLAGAPDILVNAAGAFTVGAAADTPLAVFDAALATNLRGPFQLIAGLLPHMQTRGTGHIVSIGSIAGRIAFAGNSSYSAGKFGLRGLHAVLDAELTGTGIRTTLIEPAATDTTLWDSIDPAATPGLPERSAMLAPEAVAEAVLFALTRAPDVAIRNIIMERS
ncbi:MAG: SDR family oxidoreductase [Longimicrobiales bacterium]